ncbi:MAG TPA: hypothetical protein VIK32_03565 [Candidatus Limnocylindrales bacterium]
MIASKRLRTPLVVAGAIMTVVALAGPASADDYAPSAGTTVLRTSASTNASTQAAGVGASAASAATTGLAFTGTNAIGIGALGGLLLVGGVTMVLVGKRRKVNA